MTKKEWLSYSDLQEQNINKLSSVFGDLMSRSDELLSLSSWLNEKWLKEDLYTIRIKIKQSAQEVLDAMALAEEIKKLIEVVYNETDGKDDPDRVDQVSFI